MEKKNLLSIGELSKITGVHIKALRYYDSLGILTPTYIDPNSGYRYYSFYQKAVVDAIQFCVDLDIPLKTFPTYTQIKPYHGLATKSLWHTVLILLKKKYESCSSDYPD